MVSLRYVRSEIGVPVLVCRRGEVASRLFEEAQVLHLSIVRNHHEHLLAGQPIRNTKLGNPVPCQHFTSSLLQEHCLPPARSGSCCI